MSTNTEGLCKKIERLANLYSLGDVLTLDKKAKLEQLIPDEIRMEIEALEQEYSEKESTLKAQIASLESEIKADVIVAGESVKAGGLQLIYNKPRVSWDTKALEGYKAAHPEIEAFRKVGEPSVSIRKAG